MTQPIDLQKLAELCAKATEGPWLSSTEHGELATVCHVGDDHAVFAARQSYEFHGTPESDAAYIARVDPQTVQAFIEAVEMLRLVLPMAKGYAREHPVGSNQDYVNAAVDALSAFQEHP